jgi:RNA recognition motif-containing protein
MQRWRLPRQEKDTIMTQKLYVGGLNAATNDARLREVFSEYGEITEAKVIMDRDSGASRGFAFVTYTSTESGEKAISAKNSSELDGSTIIVSVARPRADADRGR